VQARDVWTSGKGGTSTQILFRFVEVPRGFFWNTNWPGLQVPTGSRIPTATSKIRCSEFTVQREQKHRVAVLLYRAGHQAHAIIALRMLRRGNLLILD
jgi:hypothetical protein